MGAASQFGDDFTQFLHYSSERSSEMTGSSWIPRREDLVADGGTMAPVALAFLVDSTAGVVCGAAARPDWIVTSDLHIRVVSRQWKGTARADASVVRASKAGVLAQVVVVDEGNGDRALAVGSVNHAHIELAVPIDVPLEMPIGVRYGHYGSDSPQSPLGDHLNFRTSDSGLEMDVAGLAVNPLHILHGAFHVALAVKAAEEVCGGAISDLVTRFVSPVRNGPAVALPELVEVGDNRGTVLVEIRDPQRASRTASLTCLGLVSSP